MCEGPGSFGGLVNRGVPQNTARVAFAGRVARLEILKCFMIFTEPACASLAGWPNLLNVKHCRRIHGLA